MLKEEFQQRREWWAEALASEKYKQCRHNLADGDKRCVLGVACEVFMEHNPGVLIYSKSGEYYHGLDYFGAVLPPVVVRWFGLKTCTGMSAEKSLVEHNDTDGLPFSDLAKVLATDDSFFMEDVRQ